MMGYVSIRTLISLMVEDNVHWKPKTTLAYIEAERKVRDKQREMFYRTKPHVRRIEYVTELCDVYPLFVGKLHRCVSRS